MVIKEHFDNSPMNDDGFPRAVTLDDLLHCFDHLPSEDVKRVAGEFKENYGMFICNHCREVKVILTKNCA